MSLAVDYCARAWSLYTVGLQMVDLGMDRQTGVVLLVTADFVAYFEQSIAMLYYVQIKKKKKPKKNMT